MNRPSVLQTAKAVRVIAGVCGADHADYCFEGRFRFALGGRWALVVSPDDAGRFRLDACLRGRIRATMWCLASDNDRLADLARMAWDEAAALVA